MWIRIPPGARIFFCFECCVLSGRGLCDGLITRPEESYRMWRVVVSDLETSRMRRPWPTGGCRAKNKRTNKRTRMPLPYIQLLLNKIIITLYRSYNYVTLLLVILLDYVFFRLILIGSKCHANDKARCLHSCTWAKLLALITESM